ncbi:MAG: VOC family protein [Anaerolineae bacterium]|nr:VOC family protein [Thermoflexales bacterium]MDW8408893.1 VOC family protein [Anaerolineae bacterium]
MAVLPDMVGIYVRDMAASLQFYRLLGLDIPPGADNAPYVDVITPNGYRISWNTIEMMKGIYPDWEESPAGHRMTLAFKCDSPAEVDAVYARMVQHGYEGRKAPWDAFWGQHYAVVVDPDGNLVDLFAALPASA